jgi:hypothetical protein
MRDEEIESVWIESEGMEGLRDEGEVVTGGI